MRYSLRTLRILMFVGRPLLAWSWQSWQQWLQSQRTTCRPSLRHLSIAIHNYHGDIRRRLPEQPPSDD
jgi:hypothetical protein